MHQGFPRLLIVLGVFAVATIAYYLATEGREDFGLFNLLKGERAPAETTGQPEPFTAADQATIDTANIPLLVRLNEESTHLVEQVMPSVVSINTETKVRIEQRTLTPFGQPLIRYRNYDQKGLGSGAIVSKEGHVVTNYHVIEGVDLIQVTTHDGVTALATRIGADKAMDIAVLRIENRDGRAFQPLAFSNSDEVKVGELAFAIGNPFGLSGTVTQGTISARAREFIETKPAYLQTDVAINQGNSGGPLVNIRGEIIGINTSIYQGVEGVTTWHGVSFAIPANDARFTFERIMSGGGDRPGYLGIRTWDMGGTNRFGAADPEVLITEVAPGSPAEKAGLKNGDVIKKFANRSIQTHKGLSAQIRGCAIGQPIEIVISRHGEEITISAMVEEQPSETAPNAPRTLSELLAIEVRDLTGDERQQLAVPAGSPGITVENVGSESPLNGAIGRGDMITRVNSTLIISSRQFHKTINSLPTGEEASISMMRAGAEHVERFTPVN